MTPKLRTAIIVSAPLVAVATLMLGLRVGAGSGFRAALVFAAAPGKGPTPDAPRPYAWQVMTYFEERGVRETIPVKALTVIARTPEGEEVRWTGSSNDDGIAEVGFSFKNAPARIAMEVNVAGESEPLALGFIDMHGAPVADHPTLGVALDIAKVRPTKREGALDVYIDGTRLVVGASTDIWVHGEGEIKATPELGVTFDQDTVATQDHWALFHARALGQAASTSFDVVKTGEDPPTHWFGTLPTAPGAFDIHIAPVIDPNGGTALLVAPNPRHEVYVEIDDDEGRVVGSVLPLAASPGDPIPHARFDLPKLAPGTHWLVASGDPRGAEKLSGATVAKAFWVDPVSPSARLPRSNALSIADPGFPRWLAIDGIATRGAQNRSRHRRGLFIGLVALGAAALLEVLLLTAASREAQLALAAAETDDPVKVTAQPPGGGIVIALLVAILGFAALAALTVMKA